MVSKISEEKCDIDNNVEENSYENNVINIIIDFIKDEILKSNIRYEIVKPILLYILYSQTVFFRL